MLIQMGKRLFKLFIFALGLGGVSLAHATLPFLTATVAYRVTDETYVSEAIVEAAQQSTVAAQIAGRIVAINFDAGDYVQKGQVLVRIDATQAAQAVAGSQAQVAQAQATLHNARAHYERTQALFAQKFVSQAALDKALAEYKAAQAQAQASQAGAGVAATTKSFSTIVAPYSGVVAARHVELGEMASPGKPLMTGFDPKDLRVVADIPQVKVAAVSRSPRAQIEFPALNKWVKPVAMSVLPAADAKTHTVRVRLDLPSDLRDVFPGMFARVHFITGSAKKLLLPSSAIVRRSELVAVYVVGKNNQVQLRQVRLGNPTGQNEIEILAGLVPGEVVAIEPIKAGIYLKSKKS